MSSQEPQNPTDHDRTSDFVRKAGDLVSKFLLRRKRFSTVVIASDDRSPPVEDCYAMDLGTRQERSSFKPSVIAVPTPDHSNATQSQISGSGSGSDRGGNVYGDNSPSSQMELNQGESAHRKRHKTGRDSFTEDTRSIRTQSSVPSKAYQATCYAIISADGRRCSALPMSKGRYCEIHASPKSSEECKGRHPSESCDEHDQWFYGEEGTSRCLAISGSQRRCQEMAVQHFEMCRRHLKYPPKRCFLPPESLLNLAEKVITPEFDDGEGLSKGYEATDSESDDDSDLNLDDLSSEDSDDSEDSYDDGSSISSSDDESLGDTRPSAQIASASTNRPERSGAGPGRRHAASWDASKQKVRPTTPSRLVPGRVKAFGVCFEEPSEFDHSKDRLFSAKGTRLQCHFESRDGTRCLYQRKKGTDIYCHGHDVLTPQVLARMAKSGVKIDSSDDGDSSTSGESGDENEARPSIGEPRTYTHREFLKMWKNFENFYMSTDEIENSKQIRSANQSMCPDDTDGQEKAQYGRLLPAAMKVRRPPSKTVAGFQVAHRIVGFCQRESSKIY